jgi:hypothetical protein
MQGSVWMRRYYFTLLSTTLYCAHRSSQATLNYVLSHPVLQSTKLVLIFPYRPKLILIYACSKIYYGQSIGGAVAIDLASRNPSNVSFYVYTVTTRHLKRHSLCQVHALILENTFLSIVRNFLSPDALKAD